MPFWVHTFALTRVAGIYTPGVARDHRYHIPALPARFDPLRVLDVRTFDGLVGDRFRAGSVTKSVVFVDVTARWLIESVGQIGR